MEKTRETRKETEEEWLHLTKQNQKQNRKQHSMISQEKGQNLFLLEAIIREAA